jgi:polyisoprenyl-phosphate glycosyltransferase
MMSQQQENASTFTLTVIVPVYNEQSILKTFHGRLSHVLASLKCDAEILYVNDGSSDGSLAIMRRLRASDGKTAILDLSRNFGKEIAISAGLDHANGDAVVLIDADLQDPPELIPALVERWWEGFDVVYARRTERVGESYLKKATAFSFYRVIQRLCDFSIPADTGDYRLLSARAVRAMRQFHERHRFMKGLFAWIGYAQSAVEYQREARQAGQSKFTYWKLWNLALEGITSFSVGPLKIATYLGLFIAFWAFLFAGWIVLKTILYGEPVQGYPTMMTTILLLGGMQLTAIGLLGEYVGRIFNETKRRPLYFVNTYDEGVPDKARSRQPNPTPDQGLT